MNYNGNLYLVHKIETRTYNDKNFYSRKFVIEQPRFDSYTGEKKNSNFIEFELNGNDSCQSIDNFKIGDRINVTFVIEGRQYEKKDSDGKSLGMAFFNKITALKVELYDANRVEAGAPSAPSTPQAPAAPAAAPAKEEASDDLPFDNE